MMKLKKILVPVDFSKEAELAVEWAVKLGKEEKGATIFLLHVLLPTPTVEAEFNVDKIVEAEWENAEEMMDAWRRKIPPPLSSIAIIGAGSGADEIAQVCDKENIDLVVMTTHGRRGLARIVHPNLSEKVVRTAHCPVLVLHLNAKMEALAV